MRAIVVRRFGGPAELRLELVSRPRPAAGELLVRVIAAGLNPVDAQNRADGSWAGIEPPYIPGSDGSGVVVALGPGTNGFAVGDEVFCFSDYLGGRAGSYAEYHAVPSSVVARKPPGVSHDEAATVPLAGGTAYEVVGRLAPEPGEWIAV
jgi:NADPH:quinone reductase